MNENDKKLKILVDETTQEIWGKNVEAMSNKELITLRLNMMTRKRHGTFEESPIFDELIDFIDNKGWLDGEERK